MKEMKIIEVLRKNGFRITTIRRALFEIFSKTKKPLAVQDVVSILEDRNIAVNKTTVYREIEFMIAQNVIRQVSISKDRTFFEWISTHHHHIVCVSCKTVEDVDAKALEKMLAGLQTMLKRSSQFSKLDHSLEFFGTCKKCTI